MIMKDGSPHLKNGMTANNVSPEKELIEIIEFLEFENIEELFEEHQQKVFKEVVVFSHAVIMVMADLGGIETENNEWGWIGGIMDKSDSRK